MNEIAAHPNERAHLAGQLIDVLEKHADLVRVLILRVDDGVRVQRAVVGSARGGKLARVPRDRQNAEQVGGDRKIGGIRRDVRRVQEFVEEIAIGEHVHEAVREASDELIIREFSSKFEAVFEIIRSLDVVEVALGVFKLQLRIILEVGLVVPRQLCP